MSKELKTVSVKHLHDSMFQVESWREPNHPHNVCLTENNGNGFCTCKYFNITCMRNLKENGGRVVPYGTKKATLCRHLTAARFHWTNTVLREMASQYGQST